MTSKTISINKAFGILLMVMAHAGCPKITHDFIYMFHMPLFFLMSGYCFKPKYIDIPKQFVVRRVKGLYVPYVKYGLLFLLFHNVFFSLNIYNAQFGFNGEVSSLYSLTDFVRHATIVVAMNGNEQLLGGYWFLRCLFWGALISFLTIKYVKNNIIGGGILLFLTMVTSVFPIIHIPYLGINSRVFLSALFFMVGYIIKQRQVVVRSGIFAVLFAIVVFSISIIMPTSMMRLNAWQIIPYCACAVMGTLMVTYVSTKIAESEGKPKTFMVWIGNHTLTILTWHFLSFKLVSLLIIAFHHLPIEHLAEFPVITEYASGYWPLYFIVGTALPLLINYLGTVYIKFKKIENHDIF